MIGRLLLIARFLLSVLLIPIFGFIIVPLIVPSLIYWILTGKAEPIDTVGNKFMEVIDSVANG